MILDDYQTYIGVLATFLVLCLYNTLDNFILHTILKIGESFVDLLNSDIFQIRRETYNKIFPIQDEIRKKLEKLKKEKGITKITEEEKALNKIINDAQFSIHEFTNEADSIDKGALDKRPNTENKHSEYEKEELTFVALSSLIFIIITMVIDCMNFIPLAYRSMFLIFILMFSFPFYCLFYSLFLFSFDEIASWLNHPFFNPKEKKVSLRMMVGVAITILIWVLYSCIINNELISLFLLPLIWTLGIYYLLYQQVYNMRIRGKQINHIFVIQHSLYIAVLASVCSLAIFWIKATNINFNSIYPSDKSTFDLVCSQEVAKYSCVIMFTLNSFLMPLVCGYILMRREWKDVKNELNQIREKYSVEINRFLEDLNHISERIDEGGINVSIEEKVILEKSHTNKDNRKHLEKRLRILIGAAKWDKIKTKIKRMLRKAWRKRHQ